MPEYTHMDISLMAEMIADAHKSPLGEFKGFIIEGKVRTGKTVFSIKGMRDVLTILNPKLSLEEAYKAVLKLVYFEVEPFLELIQNKQREIRENLPKIDWTQRIPVVTLDDASLYAGTDLYIQDPAMYSAFQNTMTTIGSAVSAVIITCPSHLALTKCLREYYSYYIVKISKYDKYRREAKIMEWYEKKGHKLDLREVGTDEFTAHVPNAIYAEYLEPRMKRGEEKTEDARAISAARKAAEAERLRQAAEEALKPIEQKRTRRTKKQKLIEERPPEVEGVALLR